MTSFGSSNVWMCRSTLIQCLLSILLVLILVLDFHQQESNRGSTYAKATARQVTRIPRIRVVQGIAEQTETCHGLRFAEHFARVTRSIARVVEWQTRTFEGRMPKGMRVQVPPRAPNRLVT